MSRSELIEALQFHDANRIFGKVDVFAGFKGNAPF